MDYIDVTMKIINDLTDRIYEALHDKDYKDLNRSVAELMSVLRDVQQSTKEES
jgi:uncharacterized protein (UPF0297 family)